MKESALEGLSEEAFDNISSFLWFPEQSSLLEASKCLRSRTLTPKILSGMLELCLARTGREVVDMHEHMLLLTGEDSKADSLERLKELTTRITPYPTYFDWLANLVDWEKLVLRSSSSSSSSSSSGGRVDEFLGGGRNSAKNYLQSLKLRPDSIDCIELKPEEPFFRGELEGLGMNSGRRALLYQGRKLGGNRCIVANDHFPFLPAVSTDLSDDFGRGIASRVDYPPILRPSRAPFTRVLSGVPALSCVAYFEVSIYNPRRPENAKNYSTEWLNTNPPCVAIGLAYPSPAKKKKPLRPVSRTESGDDLRSYAIDSNSAMEHFDTAPGIDQEDEDPDDIDLAHQTFRLRRHLPGWDGQSVGYHGDDGNIFDGDSFEAATHSTLGMRAFLAEGPYGSSLTQDGVEFPSVTDTFPTETCPRASNAAGTKFGAGDVIGCGIIYPPLADAFTVRSPKPSGSEDTARQRTPPLNHDGEGLLYFTKNGKVVFMTPFNVDMPQSELPRIARPWFPVVGLDSYCPVEFNFGNSSSNPLAFDVLAFEKHLFDLKRSRGCSSSPVDLTEELRKITSAPPLPRKGHPNQNDMLAAMVTPLRVVTSLGTDSAIRQMRSGRCLRGNFIDWTRSIRILPNSADAKETGAHDLPSFASHTAAPLTETTDDGWNDGVLSLLSSKDGDYYSHCQDLAMDIATCYDARKLAQPPLVGISSVGSRLSEVDTHSRSRSGSNHSFSDEKSSSSSSRAGSFTMSAKPPGHFKAWEDAGEHLSAHSMFLNSSLSASIKSLLRAYRLHSRVILDEVVRDHREGQHGTDTASAARSRLINLLERSFGAAGGGDVTQMVVDSAVEEVWQMILPDDDDGEVEEEGEGDHANDGSIELGSGSNDSDDESYVDEGEGAYDEALAHEMDSDEESLKTSSDEEAEGQADDEELEA